MKLNFFGYVFLLGKAEPEKKQEIAPIKDAFVERSTNLLEFLNKPEYDDLRKQGVQISGYTGTKRDIKAGTQVTNYISANIEAEKNAADFYKFIIYPYRVENLKK